jgi:hypothetical protein
MVVCACAAMRAAGPPPAPPRAGKPEILKLSEVRPGMKGVVWTVLSGTRPEAVPAEIVGLWKNAWGPRQDVILAKLGGAALRTGVASGMSGSPLYIDGKLAGAVALRVSVFSPDAVCGITPIELMLEIDEMDQSRPRAGTSAQPMAAIEMPLSFSGFTGAAMRDLAPVFQELGVTAVQGGAAGNLTGARPAAGWQQALNPGEMVAGVLVSGDMNVTGMGTVTYNDGRRVLAFGHSFFNLGPVSMPMSRGEVLMTMASSYQPTKLANATAIVGALRQDRHSGILGELGREAPMIPVAVEVRSFDDGNAVRSRKQLGFNVFVDQKWTPYLMMLTLYNSLSGLNEFAEETTYRLSGTVEMDGRRNISLATMQASGEMGMPAPMALAGWWADKFNRLYMNPVETPAVKRVRVAVDLLPARRVASIEGAWVANPEVRAGGRVPVKVALRPYRGERIERNFEVQIPVGLARGEHRIVLSDADTANRMQSAAGMMNRYIDVEQTVSLLNQERRNNQLYVSLVEATPTAYFDDKTLPSLPASALNVMQAGRAANRPVLVAAETALEQMALPFDYVISGSYTLKINVK